MRVRGELPMHKVVKKGSPKRTYRLVIPEKRHRSSSRRLSAISMAKWIVLLGDSGEKNVWVEKEAVLRLKYNTLPGNISYASSLDIGDYLLLIA